MPKLINISGLNPLSSGFFLKAKVLVKTDLRPVRSASSADGLVFNLELADETVSSSSFSSSRNSGCNFLLFPLQGRIRVAFFNEIAKKFYTALDVGTVYNVSNLTVKQATWSTAAGKYELWAKKESSFEVDENQGMEVAQETMAVTPLNALSGGQKQPADIVGVVRLVSEISNINKGSMRELEIGDNSGKACLLTLWGTFSSTNVQRGDIIAVTKATVSTFMGVSLRTSAYSIVTVNPDTDEAALLTDWLETNGMGKVDSLPLAGKEKRRKTEQAEKIASIQQEGSARVTIKTIFIDRKMTFFNKRTESIGMVLKMAVEDESERTTPTGKSLFLRNCFFTKI